MPRRPDRVERIHGGDEPEPWIGDDPLQPRHVQLALAHHRDEDVERLLRHPVELLDVQQRPVTHRRDQRPVDEDVGVVPLGEHSGRIEVPDESRRRQLRVALDELEADAQLVGDGPEQRRLAGAGRPFDHDVSAGLQRGEHELELPLPPDQASGQSRQRGADVTHRP